jgi:hypothetical protein
LIRFGVWMRHHRVDADRLASHQTQPFLLHSFEQLVIFSAPTDESIRKAVHLTIVFGTKCQDTTDQLLVRQHVSKRTDANAQMTRNVGARVQIELIFRQQIDVMKHEAIESILFGHFGERGIVQQSLVERISIVLFDHEHLILDLLSVQKAMQVRQKHAQLIESIAIRDQNGDSLTRNAVIRLIRAAILKVQFVPKLFVGRIVSRSLVLREEVVGCGRVDRGEFERESSVGPSSS